MSKAYETVTEAIIKRLEAGVVPWRKPWSSYGNLGDCKNLISLKPYRGMNAFLTSAMGYESPYFLTYKQALELGANVKKGEKGIPIIFFSKFEKENAAGEIREIPMFRIFTVFNAEQCENLRVRPELLKPKRVREFAPIEACEKIVSKMPMGLLRIQHAESRAYYSPSLDYINMPKQEAFDSDEEYYSTLFHELGHATGHENRLNRDTLKKINSFGDHSYSREELVAEMTNAFLSSKAGIDGKTLDNSASYIASWLKALRNDPEMVVKAAGQAQKAADYILDIKPEVKAVTEFTEAVAV